MPEPAQHESMNAYLGRFVGAGEARKDFPKPQRAISYSKHRKRKAK